MTKKELEQRAFKESSEVLRVWLHDSRRDVRRAARIELRARGERVPKGR